MNPVSIESPFPLYAIPRVWQWIEASIGPKMDDAAPKTLDEFIERWIEAEQQPGRRSWAVMREGVLGGIFFSNRLTPYVADLHVVFKKEFYGHKTTQTALAMVLSEIFAPDGEDGVIKIESKVLPGNAGRAVVGLVCSVGGSKEGMALGHTLRGGKPLDVVMVGIERSKFNDWTRRRLQLEQHLERVPDLGAERNESQPEPAAGGGLPGHLRGAAPIPHQPTGGGEPVAHGSTQPGQ